MKLSARNVIRGKIKSIDVGAVNVDLLVEIPGSIFPPFGMGHAREGTHMRVNTPKRLTRRGLKLPG